MPNGIEELRRHLFETMAELRSKENPMDVDRARAVAEVGKQIIESAKVEATYIRRGQRLKSAFIEVEEGSPLLNPHGRVDDEPNPHTPRLKAGIEEMRGALEKKANGSKL